MRHGECRDLVQKRPPSGAKQEKSQHEENVVEPLRHDVGESQLEVANEHALLRNCFTRLDQWKRWTSLTGFEQDIEWSL